MPQTGYPTPDAPIGDVQFKCIPVLVPHNSAFGMVYQAAIYGLYAQMSNSWFWRETGTLSPIDAAFLASKGLAATEAYGECFEEATEDTCQDYATDSALIAYAPQDPYTEPDLVPTGYLMPPFWRVGGLIPEFLQDWFGDIIADIIDQFTGYEANDILATIGSFPIFGNWNTILTEGLPRFTITVENSGTLELHLLSVPLGGRLLVSVDIEFTVSDIIDGIVTEGFKLIELERDFSSVPPELDVDHIEEILLEGAGTHIIYCTFLPVIDLDAIPLKFGGGIRKITWCPDDIADLPSVDCTIEELLSDATFFSDEYVPAIFGEYYTETVANETAQAAIYDSTPQSIGALIPASTPDAIEQNALCSAVAKFVNLYASTKLCLIQSKNFLEIFWTNLAGAVNDMYDAVTNLMSPIYSPNLNSCFVSDVAAITALTDEAAIEELACFIYDELKTVVMSQANFDAAITDATTTLSGNAQKIACVMDSDNSLSVYINMLEAYQVQLVKQSNNQDVECPCETNTYWMKVIDFANGDGGFYPSMSSNLEQAVYGGSYWNNRSSNPPNNAWTSIMKNFDRTYVIKASAMEFSALGFTGVGSDSLNIAAHVEYNRGGAAVTITNVTFWATDGANQIRNGYIPANTTPTKSISFSVFNGGAPTGSNYSRIHRVVTYGLPNAGIKPVGSVWVSSVPVSPDPLFP